MPCSLSPPVLAGLSAALLCLALPWLLLLRRRNQNRLLRERIARIRQKIESTLDEAGPKQQGDTFGTALKAARLTTELQRPRLEKLARVDKQAPEKYRILSHLASQGLNIEEIASMVGISAAEAHQLLNLSRVAKGGR